MQAAKQVAGEATKQAVGETTKQVAGEATKQAAGETTKQVTGEVVKKSVEVPVRSTAEIVKKSIVVATGNAITKELVGALAEWGMDKLFLEKISKEMASMVNKQLTSRFSQKDTLFQRMLILDQKNGNYFWEKEIINIGSLVLQSKLKGPGKLSIFAKGLLEGVVSQNCGIMGKIAVYLNKLRSMTSDMCNLVDEFVDALYSDLTSRHLSTVVSQEKAHAAAEQKAQEAQRQAGETIVTYTYNTNRTTSAVQQQFSGTLTHSLIHSVRENALRPSAAFLTNMGTNAIWGATNNKLAREQSCYAAYHKLVRDRCNLINLIFSI